MEHLAQPFVAAKNMAVLCRTGGLIIAVAPFSQRFHGSPNDFFWYTHHGLEQVFRDSGDFETLLSGYDILGRRNNWQGNSDGQDQVPKDMFGAWRETWFSVVVLKKLSNSSI